MSIPLPLRLILVSVVFVLSASFNASLPSLTIWLSDFTQNKKKLISCVFGTGTISFLLAFKIEACEWRVCLQGFTKFHHVIISDSVCCWRSVKLKRSRSWGFRWLFHLRGWASWVTCLSSMLHPMEFQCYEGYCLYTRHKWFMMIGVCMFVVLTLEVEFCQRIVNLQHFTQCSSSSALNSVSCPSCPWNERMKKSRTKSVCFVLTTQIQFS